MQSNIVHVHTPCTISTRVHRCRRIIRRTLGADAMMEMTVRNPKPTVAVVTRSLLAGY